MKNFKLTLLLIFVASSVFSQAEFTLDQNITSGPYMTFDNGELTLYTWGKKKGILSKKIRNSYNGKTSVEVDALSIQKFNNAGELISEELIAAEFDDSDVSGLGTYVICPDDGNKYTICDEEDAFAKKGDPSVDEIIKEYPLSTGIKDETGKIEYSTNFGGSGLLGLKKPFLVSVSKKEVFENGDFKIIENKEQEVKEIKTKDKNSSWAPEFEFDKEKLYNPTNGSSLKVYANRIKNDKTKKYNYLQEKKIMTFDNTGKMVAEKDIMFDKAMFSHQNLHIHDDKGNVVGLALIFVEAWGIGFKKANPNLDRQNFKVLLFDESGIYQDEYTMRYPHEMGMLDAVVVPFIIKRADEYHVFLKIEKKKKTDRKAALISFVAKDETVTDGSKLILEDIAHNGGGPGSRAKMYSTSFFDRVKPLNDGSLMFTSTISNVDEQKVETYLMDYYYLLNNNLELVSKGFINSFNDPFTSKYTSKITQVSDNTLVYKMDDGTKSTVYTFDLSTKEWNVVTSPNENYKLFATEINNSDLYLISRSIEKPEEFRLDKMTF